jgi:hypothetical protein
VLPFFEGQGRRGEQEYLRQLVARGEVVSVDGQLQLADSAGPGAVAGRAAG